MKLVQAMTLAGALLIGTMASFAGDNLLMSEDFSKESGWATWIHKAVADAGGKIDLVNGNAICAIPSTDKQANWMMQIAKHNLDLRQDATYILKFKAKSDKAGKFHIGYILNKEPRPWYAVITVNIEPGEKEYSFKFTPKADKDGNYDSPRKLDFCVGALTGAALTLSDVSLEEAK